MNFRNAVLFGWDPDSERPFEIVNDDDLDGTAKEIFDMEDIKDSRLKEFVVPDLGEDKKFSMFKKIQGGVPASKRKEEVARLNDQFFRLLENGMTFNQAYSYMVVGEKPVLMIEEASRKTRNSQVGHLKKIYLKSQWNLFFCFALFHFHFKKIYLKSQWNLFFSLCFISLAFQKNLFEISMESLFFDLLYFTCISKKSI